MKKISKKLICILASAILLLVGFSFICSAAPSLTVSADKTTVNVGDTVTARVTLSTDQEIYGCNIKLTYNASVLQYVSGGDSGSGAGVVKIVDAPASKSLTNIISFKALANGSSSLSFVDSYFTFSDLKNQYPAGNSVSVVVAAANASNNADLTELRSASGALSPTFSKNVTSYTVTVPENVTSGRLYATTADPNAKISVEGNVELKPGRNVRTVVVTAPGGAVKKYTITFIRGEDSSVSSDTASNDTPDGNPLEVTVSDKKYLIQTDLSGISIPSGFEVQTETYKDTQIQVAKNQDYTIFYLKAEGSDTAELFTLNNSLFEPLKYMNFGGKFYIFEDDGKTSPTGYKSDEVDIGGFSVNCYSSRDKNYEGFYYFYCYVDSYRGYFRYDSLEKTLQREPGFGTGKAIQVASNGEDEAKDKSSFMERFRYLSDYAKITVAAIVLIIISAIVLIVLLILKFFGKGDEESAFEGEIESEYLLDDEIFDDADFEASQENQEREDK